MTGGRRNQLYNRRLAARWLAAGEAIAMAAQAAGCSIEDLQRLLARDRGFRVLVDEYRREAQLPPAARMALLRARCIEGARHALKSGQRLSPRDRALLENLIKATPPPDPLASLLASLAPEALKRLRDEEDEPGPSA